jgi:alpha-amylase
MRPTRDASGNYTGWDQNNELGGNIDPFNGRLAAAYAVAMSMDGSPMIYFEDLFNIGNTGKGFSHRPVRDDIVNLIWAHKMLAFKYTAYKVRWQAPDLLVIERSGQALIGVTDNWTDGQKQVVQTDFPPGSQLHDYSGANSNDVTVGGDSKVEIWVPPCNGTNRRRCYAVFGPAGVIGNPAGPERPTTQEWELSDDIGDSNPKSLGHGGALPAQSTAPRLAGHVFAAQGKPMTVNVYATDKSQNLVVTVSQKSNVVQKASGAGDLTVSYTPASTGWYGIRVANVAAQNPSQTVFVKAMYTAPQVVDTAKAGSP